MLTASTLTLLCQIILQPSDFAYSALHHRRPSHLNKLFHIVLGDTAILNILATIFCHILFHYCLYCDCRTETTRRLGVLRIVVNERQMAIALEIHFLPQSLEYFCLLFPTRLILRAAPLSLVGENLLPTIQLSSLAVAIYLEEVLEKTKPMKSFLHRSDESIRANYKNCIFASQLLEECVQSLQAVFTSNHLHGKTSRRCIRLDGVKLIHSAQVREVVLVGPQNTAL
mmetsp:Transcript_91194/g.142345  ORF Transcript_91194/g.142345 Transcript_91194/m.142345 type:complete len:227 (+) Transcript_91194:26-706(+)